MKPDRHTSLKINEMGCDRVTGEHVLVINCRCTLPHDNTEVYTASHADGCLMKPSEGLVLEMDGDRVTGWGCHDIFGRDLVKADDAKAADIKRQMDERLEADRKRRKRRPRPVW